MSRNISRWVFSHRRACVSCESMAIKKALLWGELAAAIASYWLAATRELGFALAFVISGHLQLF